MIDSEDELYNYLVGICDYDPGDVSDYLKYHSDEINYPIANQDLDKLEAKIGDWLGIGINESTVDKLKEVYVIFEETSLGEYYVDEFDNYKAAYKKMHDLKQEDMSKKLIIKKVVRNCGAMKESKNVPVSENTTFREFINETGFVDYIDETDTQLINESTETDTPDDGISDGETYDQWKMNVFKYLDKRIDVNKVKELGTYIKDFIKQEYDAGEPSWFVVAESVVNYARMKYPEVMKNRESNAFNITEGMFNKATQKIWEITFGSEDEANEEYYLFANEGGWDSVFEMTQKDNKIYVMDSKQASKIVNEWFGDKAELVRLNPEEYNDIFSLDESVKNVKPNEYVGIVEFYTEDGAYDAIGAWDKMKNPSIKPMSAFDIDTIIQMKEYNTYKQVDAEKLEREIQITAPTKKLLLMAMDWLTEVDEDAVIHRHVCK